MKPIKKQAMQRIDKTARELFVNSEVPPAKAYTLAHELEMAREEFHRKWLCYPSNHRRTFNLNHSSLRAAYLYGGYHVGSILL